MSMVRLTRKALAACAALIAVLSAPAAAQNATFLDAPSPEKIAVSAGGVDVRTGRHTYSATDVAVGEGPGALSLERTMPTPMQGHVAPFGNFSHNWDIVLVIKPVPLDQYPGNYDYLANVSYGGRSQTFEKLYLEGSSQFVQKSQNDFTRLTTTGTVGANNIVYTYQATDGTVAVFRPINTGKCISGSYSYQCANVDYIVEPDGTRYDFEYDTTTGQVNNVRLRAVTSNRGYALLLEYGAGGASWNHVSKACVLNLGQTTKPASNVCPGGALQTASYTYSSIDGRLTLASATAPDNAVDTFTYTPVVAGQSYQMGYKKAGQASAWMTNRFQYSTTSEGEEEPVVAQQSFADGSGYTYYYDVTPDTTDGTGQSTSYQTIAGGSYVNALGQLTQLRYDFPAMPQSFSPPRVPSAGGMGGYMYVYLGDRVYQATGGPVSVIDPLGRETVSDYCDANAMANLPPQELNRCLVTRLQSTTDPEGNAVKITYGVNGNVVELRRVAKPGSGLADSVATASYDTNACINYLITCNKPLSVTDPKGITTDYTWAAAHGGVLTETRGAPTSGAVRPQKRFTYGQFHAWYRNASGTLVQSPHPVWLVTQISECATGAAPACVGTADETVTTFTYGAPGIANNLLQTSKTVAAGDGSLSVTVSWTYDTFGNKLTEDGPLPGAGDTTRWRYDVRRRVVGVVGPDPDGAGALRHPATRNTYDTTGRLVKVESGHVAGYSDTDWNGFVVEQTAETAYDALDRKVKQWSYGPTGGIQQLTQTSYDLAGRPECVAVRMNPAAYGSLPTSACTLGATGANGPDRITRTIYDAAGQVLQVRKAVGTTLEMADVTYSYTLNGKIKQVIDANGNRAELRYDGHDRQSRWVFPAKTRPTAFNPATPATALTSAGALNEADYEEYAYDVGDNRISLRKRDGWTITYLYDALNRVTKKTLPARTDLASVHRRHVFYSYDLRGLQTSARFASATGQGILTSWDGFGRQVSVLDTIDSKNRTVAYQYDANSNRTKITYPDAVFFTYEHDGLNRATALKDQSGTALISPTYNNRGLISTLQRPSGTHSGAYTYDPIGRLGSIGIAGGSSAAEVTWSFSRNPASQILTEIQTNDAYSWDGHVNLARSYTTNGLNQYEAAGSAAFCYDANGNLTADGTNVYKYDVENRLVERRAQGTGNTNCAALSYAGTLQAELRYDPLGRLYYLRDYVGPNGITRFAYDGDAMIAEYNNATTLLRRYVHGSNAEADDPLVWYEGTSVATANARHLHADPRGSIVLVAGSAGQTLAINTYDEYGIPDSASGNDIATKGRFRYTGQAWLPELDMYHYKARVYSPTLGRFLQTDPIGYEDQFNLYAYVANDPVNLTDFTGRAPGDVFDRPEDAARDAVDHINPTSIAENREYIGTVDRVTSHVPAIDSSLEGNPATPQIGYVASDPVAGGGTSASTSGSTATMVGQYHTHADYSTVDPTTGDAVRIDPSLPQSQRLAADQFDSENFSSGTNPAADTNIAERNAALTRAGRSEYGETYKSYLGTPSGAFRIFVPPQ